MAATGGKGNFVAIGTFDPAIELWDLDVIDALQPTTVLGGLTEVRRTVTLTIAPSHVQYHGTEGRSATTTY